MNRAEVAQHLLTYASAARPGLLFHTPEAPNPAMPVTHPYEDIPDLWTFDLPKEERHKAEELQSLLQEMAVLTDEVASAVALFDFARQRARYLGELLETNPADRIASPQKAEQETVCDWQFIAARAVVVAVWQMDEARSLATSLAGAVPAIAALIDRNAIKESNLTFGSYFQEPDTADEGVPHGRGQGEPGGSPRRLVQAAPGVVVRFEGDLAGSRITYTRKGVRLRLDISEQTVKKLLQVRGQYFAAFATVGQTLQERHWQETHRNAERQSED